MGRARSKKRENTYRILVGKPEGKRPLEKPRCWWVYIVKMDLREIEWRVLDSIDLTQDMGRLRVLAKKK
jgi:hypothetical protein